MFFLGIHEAAAMIISSMSGRNRLSSTGPVTLYSHIAIQIKGFLHRKFIILFMIITAFHRYFPADKTKIPYSRLAATIRQGIR